MKSKMLGNVALWLALCGALLGLAACSEKSTAGATVDDNSVAEISADEKLILEHQVDSVKNFVDGIPADIDDYERDTTRFWFEIRFSGEHENFFAYEEENPYSYCDVRIYPSEYGVKAIGYIPNGIVGYDQTFFLTADSEGVAYHEKLDGFYYDEYSCEKYYADFEKKTDNLSIVMLGYLAVANIQGVEYEDSAAYFAKNLLQAAFSRLSSANTSNSYTIYDDTNMSDGVTIEKDPSDTRTIYASEFGDHVMEYVNAMYGEKTSYKDTEGFNTFEWTTERQDVTTTSCRLVSTMIVNLDADFSKLKGYSGAITDSFMNGDITEQNADYLIKLKVGQKCNIVSSEKIVGYETSGSSCIEFNSDKTVITATAVGKANGYIYVGDSNTKKSIYVIVEANTENQTLNPISIKIDTASNSNPSNVDITKTDNSKTDEVKADTSNTKTTANTDTKDDSTISATTLPKTGTSETIVVIGISICMILAIIFAIKNKKYKDIK